ncbi:SCO3374 family protein [Streptomyces sp. SP18CS02]|uniref:SCO3374 family protein n=1 Tax=Streptomyces sp. SP18CS02 TaxID=3002531 RepID=UPI002E77560A|nr:SCO3374 family protein [Streptomyces sp. SP18CS02]MEE1756701.1 SCO3374 family protein [Streptomyces sp. SP18CS02]
MAFTLPQSRTQLDGGGADERWYEDELGWATAGGPPVQLLTGLRFDVLELPAAAGFAVLRRLDVRSPVALMGRRMRVLVAAGSADELPGLLDWLEWGGVALDLTALGAGGRMTAPVPPGWSGSGSPGDAVWLRPPEPGREVEPTLPALPAVGGGGDAPGLVRLVDTAAAECHRVRLLGAGAAAQRLASS